MKKPTELLGDDHKEVLRKLDEMEAAIARLQEGDAVVLGTLREIGAFIKKDVESHLVKEEEGLFPEMEKFMPRNQGPIGVMLMEHEDLRRSTEKYLQGLERINGGPIDTAAASQVVDNGTHFIYVLRGHIDKEDNILFMMADMHLDESQNVSILKKFDEIAGKFR